MCARRAVSVRRGSITMSRRPRAIASVSRRPGFCIGRAPLFEISGFWPTTSQLSARSNSCPPACQKPCSAIAICLPGWSIVFEVKSIREPIARSHALASCAEAG